VVVDRLGRIDPCVGGYNRGACCSTNHAAHDGTRSATKSLAHHGARPRAEHRTCDSAAVEGLSSRYGGKRTNQTQRDFMDVRPEKVQEPSI
jgi:hypothetical protein